MAHWIVNDKGLGGAFWTCSRCGKTYWDIADTIDNERCPCCHSPINSDENEYYEDSAGDWRR